MLCAGEKPIKQILGTAETRLVELGPAMTALSFSACLVSPPLFTMVRAIREAASSYVTP